MKNTDKISPFVTIAQTFGRYHLTLFIVVLVGGLSTAVLMLNEILMQSSDTNGYTSSLNNSGFDQATIDRLKQLKSSSEASTDLTLPAGRVNPFAE